MLVSTSKLALLAATLAVAANAQDQCSAKQTQCAEDNESLLLKCDGKGSWETQTCGANMYCMTMNSAMIHCMLKPENEIQTSSTQPTASSTEDQASETSAENDSSSPVSSADDASSTGSSPNVPTPSAGDDNSSSDKSTSSGALSNTNGNNAVIAAVAGLAIIGMGALF
ncbi:hypothetical protein H4R99_008128 [Coemansia sp. RSA 1722]|nr:hypothetical protein IWW45_003284 [Coemansia sp. RSA 485]KAJ2587508.1 hypothetical protein H4R99_008128 [Coemansia sp. RSA 1722]KAJ2636161.1 hypothetical protein GGF40_003168 [Coemansia sp. RSA 1286]